MKTFSPPPPARTERAILSWSAQSRPHHKRTIIWYICAAAVLVAFSGYAIYTQAWTFLFLIGLLTLIYLWTHRHEPDKKVVAIGNDGILYDDKFIPWYECAGFWLLQGHGYVELHIELTNSVATDVRIQTGDTDPFLIREVLSKYIKDLTGRREKVFDTITRICKL